MAHVQQRHQLSPAMRILHVFTQMLTDAIAPKEIEKVGG